MTLLQKTTVVLSLLFSACVVGEACLPNGKFLTEEQKIRVLEEICEDMITSGHMKPKSIVAIEWGEVAPSGQTETRLKNYSDWIILTSTDFKKGKGGVRVSSDWVSDEGSVRLEVEGLSGQFAPDVYDFLMSDRGWWLRKDIILRDSNCPEFSQANRD